MLGLCQDCPAPTPYKQGWNSCTDECDLDTETLSYTTCVCKDLHHLTDTSTKCERKCDV
jgi:hypothetical protein